MFIQGNNELSTKRELLTFPILLVLYIQWCVNFFHANFQLYLFFSTTGNIYFKNVSVSFIYSFLNRRKNNSFSKNSNHKLYRSKFLHIFHHVIPANKIKKNGFIVFRYRHQVHRLHYSILWSLYCRSDTYNTLYMVRLITKGVMLSEAVFQNLRIFRLLAFDAKLQKLWNDLIYFYRVPYHSVLKESHPGKKKMV